MFCDRDCELVRFSDMQTSRWRNLVTLANSIIPSLPQSSKSSHFARFHATPTACERRSGKANPEKSGGQKSPKVRISVRHNNAGSKKALKNLLNRYSSQSASSNWAAERVNSKKSQSSSARYNAKSNKKKVKSMSDKWRRESSYKNHDYSERVFEEAFGKRWNAWADKARDTSWSHEYEWRRHSRQTDDENEPGDMSSFVGSYSDRKALDLPLTGPLKIEDVKTAFRLLALKWHPDKHQGPSQEMAEEKFRLCHNAYQSLCKVLRG